MSISCDCSGDGDFEFWYEPPKDFERFDRKRRCRCFSCGNLIDIGADCGKFFRYRQAQTWVEEKIFDCDDVPLAPWFMCEECTGLYFSLTDLGYCISLEKGESMRELVRVVNAGNFE